MLAKTRYFFYNTYTYHQLQFMLKSPVTPLKKISNYLVASDNGVEQPWLEKELQINKGLLEGMPG